MSRQSQRAAARWQHRHGPTQPLNREDLAVVGAVLGFADTDEFIAFASKHPADRYPGEWDCQICGQPGGH